MLEYQAMQGPELIYEPQCLKIFTVLHICERADITFMQHMTGLARGELLHQLQRLQEAGMLTITEQHVSGLAISYAQLTPAGRAAAHNLFAEENIEDSLWHIDIDLSLRIRIGPQTAVTPKIHDQHLIQGEHNEH